MTQKERDNLLLAIYNNQQSMIEDQQSIREEQQSMKEEQQSMREDQQSMREDQQSMREEQQSMREELIKIGNTLTRIEFDHGEKLQILFEAYGVHGEQLEEYRKRFYKNENRISRHDGKIYLLEKKINEK